MRLHWKSKLGMLLIAAVALFAVGCADKPVRDVDHVTVTRYDGKALSLADMEHVIRAAAYRQEWQQVNVVEPGHIVATQKADDGKWSMTVDILYTTADFSIHYKDSQGLKYNGLTHVIARRYPSAVNDLSDAIRDAAQDIVPAS